MDCTECGTPVGANDAYIAGFEREGRLHWTWACQHHPVADAKVILNSNRCVAAFLLRHPECETDFDQLFAEAGDVKKPPKAPTN